MEYRAIADLCTTQLEIEIVPLKERLGVSKPLRLDFGVIPSPRPEAYMHWYWEEARNLKSWFDRLLYRMEIDEGLSLEILEWVNKRYG